MNARIGARATHVALCLVMSLALVKAPLSMGDEPESAAAQAPNESITITVSTQGLGQYTEEFSATVLRLERLLEEIKSAELALPAEDIQKLNDLMASSTELVEAIGDNAEQLSSVIEDAQAPVLDLSSRVLAQAQQQMVAPVIQGVDAAADKVSRTAKFAIASLAALVLLILVFVAVGGYLINARLRALLSGAGKIIDGHVVVPRDTWQALVTPPANPLRRRSQPRPRG